MATNRPSILTVLVAIAALSGVASIVATTTAAAQEVPKAVTTASGLQIIDTKISTGASPRSDLAWNFVKTNFAALAANQGPSFQNNFPASLMTNFTDAPHAEELANFAPAHSTSGGRLVAARALILKERLQGSGIVGIEGRGALGAKFARRLFEAFAIASGEDGAGALGAGTPSSFKPYPSAAADNNDGLAKQFGLVSSEGG